MLVSDLVRFATHGAAALLLITHQAQLWHLLVLFGMGGAAQAFFNPAAVGLVPEVVPQGVLQGANALLDFARNSAALVGQLLGGVLVAAFGAGVALALDSATFVVSAFALALLDVKGSVQTKAAGAFIRDLADGWSEFRSRTWLWVGTLHIALLNAFALVGFFALGPVVAQRSLGGADAWGVIGAAFAGGLIAGSGVALRWRPARPLVAAFGVIVLAAPQLALLATTAPTLFIALAAFLGGAQASFWGALWTTAMQHDVPAGALARVAAYGSLGSLVLAPVGFAAVGYVAAAVGISLVLWLGAAWIVLSTAVVTALPCMWRYRARTMPVAAATARVAP